MAARTGPSSICLICRHPNRPQIDLSIASGVGPKYVATKYDVPRHTVYRHQRHLSPEVKAALRTKLLQRENASRVMLLEEGVGVTEGFKALRGPLFALFLDAVDSGDPKVASNLAARLHENLGYVAKLTGELAPHVTNSITNIVLSPDYQRLRGELLRALADHPAAIRDVVAIFTRIGDEAARTIEHDASA